MAQRGVAEPGLNPDEIVVPAGRYARHVARTAGDGQAESLFDAAAREAEHAAAPLAVRMRPRSLDEVVGQRHLTGPGAPFRKLIDHDAAMSVVLWGPPGTGKTTLAHVVSEVDQAALHRTVGGHRGREGRARGHRHGAPRPGADRHPDRPVHRRGAPVQQGPAGRPAARRGEPLGLVHRRDHREPVLLRGGPAAVQVAAAHPGTAQRRRRARSDRPGRWPTSAGWRARSPSPGTPPTTWCCSPAGMPGGR